jgi:glycosyltransferase involved in cell wall biosynthesis
MFGHPWLPIAPLRKLEFHNNRVMRDFARQTRPDLVFCWNFSGLSKSILFTLRALDLPAVFCVCDHWVARAAEADVWLKWWNRPRFLPRALQLAGVRDCCQTKAPTNPARQLDFQRVYFCSQSLRDFTAAAGYDVRHGEVIYCHIDTELFTGEPKAAGAPLQRLLYVGRLHEDKGVLTALRAMARLRDKFAGRLTIYGRGEPAYETALRNFVEQEKLPVTFAGVSSPSEMPAVYRAHDALLFTSEWAEPFALTPLEAMACGLPVIGTTTGGSVELFRHGQNALTFSAGDSAELAQRVLDLDRDRALRSRLAASGQAEVRSRYAEPRIFRQVENYLRDSLALWRPRPLPEYHD